MFGLTLERVLISDLKRVATDIDKKIVAVGVSKILCECPSMLVPPYRNFWSELLKELISSFELPPEENPLDGDHLGDENALDVGYQGGYSQLSFAKLKTIDPLADVQDIRKYLAESLATLSQQRPGDLPTLIAALPSDHQHALQKYCAQAGVQIV